MKEEEIQKAIRLLKKEGYYVKNLNQTESEKYYEANRKVHTTDSGKGRG
jgi:biotin operon repressor